MLENGQTAETVNQLFSKNKKRSDKWKRSKSSFKQFQIFQRVSISLPVEEEKLFFTPSLLSMWPIIKQDEQTWVSVAVAEPAEPALVKIPNLSFLFFSFSSSSIWKKTFVVNYIKTVQSGCFWQWMFYKSKSWTVNSE